ncbi:MFS transporter [Elioraea sp.]|uniref:MFS transporter n=1 Tax=Elioraea sp. TaxID=2185103 RepID=UPI0025C1D17B|nr:MFS transporter [Elioraea sp.]
MAAAHAPAAPVTDRRGYTQLFAAQVIALLGTGIATVALALLSYDLAGADAGAVFGTALAIKMGAYVVIAPIAAAATARLPRRMLLVASDLVRAAIACTMPFVTSVEQIYLLIFVFQAASAVFMPLFQASIPELLPEEDDYANALARARLAYELEGPVSPIIAALLLQVLDGRSLFFSTAIAFIVSALLILRVKLPEARGRQDEGMLPRLKRGFGMFVSTPRLRGLAALNLAVAAGTAMVTVNTVVLVQFRLGHDDRATGIGLATFGIGSIAGTLVLPALLRRITERSLMLPGAAMVAAALLLGTVAPGLRLLLPLWFAIGAGCALAQTPYGFLIRRTIVAPEEKPPLYAAQFALSHLCLLLAYPLAGWLGAAAGMRMTFAILGTTAAAAGLLAQRLWPPEGDAVPA